MLLFIFSFIHHLWWVGGQGDKGEIFPFLWEVRVAHGEPEYLEVET